MDIPDAELTALAERVSALEQRSTRTVELAQQNGERITKLEQAVTKISGPDFYRATAQSLLSDPKYDALVARGYEKMISHATAMLRKNIEGWLTKPFLTNQEAAKLIAIHPNQLSAMRKRGEGPQWSGTGKLIRYERLEVERWLRELPTHDGD